MSSPLDRAHSFSGTLKFYLLRLRPRPNGTSITTMLQNDLRQIIGDPELVVQSGSVVVGSAWMQQVPAGLYLTRFPVVVSCRWVSTKQPTREEWIRALARAFTQTHNLTWEAVAPDVLPSANTTPAAQATGTGSDIVTAATNAERNYRNVQIDDVATLVTHLPVQTQAAAPPVVVAHTDSTTGERVVTTTTPKTNGTATRTVVRTNPSTGTSRTETAVVPHVDPGLANQGGSGGSSSGSIAVPVAIVTVVVLGLGYWAATSRSRAGRPLYTSPRRMELTR